MKNLIVPAAGLAMAALPGATAWAQSTTLGYTIVQAACTSSVASARTSELMANQSCECDLQSPNTLCRVSVTVSATGGAGACNAQLPYNQLRLKTKSGAGNVGVLWQLSAASGTNLAEFAYAPGSGIHLSPRNSVAGDIGSGFLDFVRFNEQNAIWFARTMPSGSSFEGLHLPVVVRLAASTTQLHLCAPADPPIINTGY